MKNLFEISIEEKNRILEMHINATKKQYLIETISKLNITVTGSDKKPVVGATIIDLGSKNSKGEITNGGATNADGKLTLPKFFGPSFKVLMTGFEEIEVTPDKEDIDVTMKRSVTTMSELEIENKDFYGKVIDSESKKSIKGAKAHGFNENEEEEEEKEFTWTTDRRGEFKSGLGYKQLTISAEGYDSLDYSVDENYVLDKKNPTIIELTKTYVAPPPSVIPPELEYLIGKEFLFLDADRKRPLQGTIETIYYIDDNKLKSIEFTLSNIDAGNTYKLTYNCSQAAFKIKNVTKSASKLKSIVKSIGTFVQDDFLYSTELKKYLKNKTKICGWNQTT
jgi:hypothetical protein